ncbi:MAG: immunoglobulin domain-containing protein [Verrucomicrobia bacterium]|nr:immunoglobulin domain-containing protein [Verrucomicrobiota bacterium]
MNHRYPFPQEERGESATETWAWFLKRRVLSASFLIAQCLLLSLSLSAALAPHTEDQIWALGQEKLRRTPAQRKLDSQLLYLGREHRGEPSAPGAPHVRARIAQVRGLSVLIDVRGDVTPALMQAISDHGGRVVGSWPRHRAIRALVPIAALEALAAHAGVERIRPADEATTNTGPIDSEGDITHKADVARAAYGIGGLGVKVGVLSDSVDHLAESQARGELPPDVNVILGQAGAGVGEGTAMLEIVHDLAPDATLYFASAFNGVASFADNIRALRAAGCQIIVDDVSYFSESPFQDGPIAQAVSDVSASGALYFSAAGNGGHKSDGTSSVWEGDFKDGGATSLGRGGRLHDFGGSATNTVVPGGTSKRLDFFWNDPLGKSANDYDVFVLDGAGNVIASSTNIQNGNDDPYESLPSISEGNQIVIVKVSGASRFLWLSVGRGRLAFSTSGAVRGHNASGAANAFSVAATWVRSPVLPFVGGAANTAELFSSDGPRRIFYNPDGTAITPGNLTSTGGKVLQKPDLTAADGVSTSIPGFEHFFGTSAAAPHAAAIAALLLSYNPALTATQARGLISAAALDVDPPGFDATTGAGILMAPTLVEAAPTPAPRLAFAAATVNGGNGNGTIDANECNQLHLEIRNRIGAAGPSAKGVTGALRSLSPSVTTDPAPIAFPDVPAGGAATNLLPFMVSTSPDFVCNEIVTLELILTSVNASSVTQQFVVATTPVGVAPAVVFESSGAPVPVPDLGTGESTIAVSGIGLPLASVSVSAHVAHTYVSDLILTLVGPDGTEVLLSSRNGNAGQNYGASCGAQTVFDDAATQELALGLAPFVGVYKPQQPLSVFAGAIGPQVNGVWKLRASDVAEPDSGSIVCWALNLSTIQCLDGGGGCFEPARIVSQPQSIAVTNGNAASFSVAAGGTAPISYAWFFQETNAIANATSPLLTLPHAGVSNAGPYSARVSNRYGSVTSAPAQLSILVPPEIVTPPLSQTATNGNPATFSVVALGSSPLTYQWFFNTNTPIPNATDSALRLTAVTPADEGTYRVQVSNPFGTTSSPSATLTVAVPPAITQQPANATVNQGADVTFQSAATGSQPLSYQWYFNESAPVPGGTGPILSLKAVTGAQNGSYQLVASNRYGRATSLPATLTVIVPNNPPSIGWISPANGKAYAASNLPVVVEVSAADSDGQVKRVDLYSDGVLLASPTAAPYRFAWVDPTAGTHKLTAIATDNLGAQGTSSVVSITVTLPTANTSFLVSTGAVWKYLDTGAFPGATWTQLGFDDSAWHEGPAELGYGDTADGRPEATLIGFGPNPNNRYISYYFRHAFFLSDPGSYTNLLIRLLRDDGAVVYLNGTEVFRSNMPDGAITPSTLASTSVGGAAETTYFTTNPSPAVLIAGTNIIAVEVHQVATNSSDISFDLELRGTRGLRPRIVDQPDSLTVDAGQSAQFISQALGIPPLSYQWFFNATNRLAGAVADQLSLPAVTLAQGGAYSLVVTNPFGAATSSPAILTVVGRVANQPPSIAWVTPTNGSTVSASDLPLLLQVNANDPESGPLRVDLFADETLLTTILAPPFSYAWATASMGKHSLLAVATDDKGLAATSAVVNVKIDAPVATAVPLIAWGSVWKYNDAGVDLGTGWIAPDYVDAAWKSGPAELGYGDTADGRPEATVIGFGPDPNNKYPAAYFRKSFNVDQAALLPVIRFKLLRDDGAVVYLNGVEQFRDNMGAGLIHFTNYALTAINGAAETNLVLRSITNAPLRNGANTLAVEIHQSGPRSSDLSFDLDLEGLKPPVPEITLQPTSRSVTNGAKVQFSIVAIGGVPLSYQWLFNNTNRLLNATNPTLSLSNVGAAQAGDYRCHVTNEFGSATSSNATLAVMKPSQNLPPTVAITTPLDGARADLGTPVQLAANASDQDGQVVSVAFYADGALLGADAAPPYQWDWPDAASGIHQLIAVATDNLGLASTSAPVRLTVVPPTRITQTLIATGSVWKYNDAGVDLGTTWRRTDFNDSKWSSGRALLGFGNAAKGRPEATLLNAGPDASHRVQTHYFRQSFVASNLSAITRLELRLLRDDGAAIYFNGVRVVRDNLPSGGLNYSTAAVAPVAGDDETRFFTNQLNVANLVVGTNWIAVELHQANPTGDDAAFDLGLTAVVNTPPILLTEPADLTVTNGSPASFSVVAIGTGALSYQWFFNTNKLITGVTGSVLRLPAVAANQAGAYSVVVQNAVGSTRSREALLKVVTPIPNVPPQVTLLSPTNNAIFALGAVVSLSASASDSDGSVSFVDFFDGAQSLARASNSPYLFDWNGASAGAHTLRAVAVDNRGASTATATVAITVLPPPPPPSPVISLVSTGAVWRYLDTGTDQGTAWRGLLFDDDAWAEGPAELGYGDAVEGRPEATVIQSGPTNNFFITSYFRRRFQLDVPSAVTNLTVSLMRDDGGVVYLNGVEVFRSNMPTGTIGFLTLASSTVSKQAETQFFSTNVPPALLRQGTNLVAVEIHQVSKTSSDVSFDLALDGIRADAPVIVSSPAPQSVPLGGVARFSVAAAGEAPLSYQWFLNTLNLIAGATNSELVLSNVQPVDEGNYSVTVANALGSATSASALLTVILPPTITAEPQSLAVAAGSAADFQVANSGTPPFVYQWFFNQTPIANATASALHLSSVQGPDAGGYSVRIANSAGSVTSSVAKLTISAGQPPASIATPPSDLTIQSGDPASFSVVAGGTPPFTYQWFFNSATPIALATNDTLHLPSPTVDDMGFYSVRVANLFSAATSGVAELRILFRPVITSIQSESNKVSLVFSSLSRLRYTVEFIDTITNGNWAPVPGAVQLKGTGLGVTVADPQVSPNKRFYRVRVE